MGVAANLTLTVKRQGAVTVPWAHSKTELLSVFVTYPQVDSVPKLLDRDNLASELAHQRELGMRVVMCNGVFDLLHVGHVRVLAAARALGDILVVAINSDTSATHHKGPGQPLQPAQERAEIICALECVDHVCIFEELDVAETMRQLKPDIHAKGEDYDPTGIPASEISAANELGIELKLVGGPKVGASRELATRLSAVVEDGKGRK